MTIPNCRSDTLAQVPFPPHTGIRSMPVAKDPLDIDTLNLDDASERTAFYTAWSTAGRQATGERLRRLRDQGIIDADGKRIASHIPPDMLDADSTVEQ